MKISKTFFTFNLLVIFHLIFADLGPLSIVNENTVNSEESPSDTPQIQFTLKDTSDEPEPETETQHSVNHQFWPKTFSYLYLRNKLIADVIRDFCKMQDIDVVISDQLLKNQQHVHQTFEKVFPADIWNQLSKSCGLMWFFDGHILYVYESSEIVTKIIKIHPLQIKPLLNLIDELHFYGSNMAIKPMQEGGIIVLTGAPKMIELLESMTDNMQVYQSLDSDVLDVRIFPLKHAWADDKAIGSLTIPGIATMLNEILGKTKDNEKLDRLPQNTKSAQKIKSIKEDENQKNEETSDKTILPEGGLITTDTRQNAIIVKDYSKNLPLYETIIQKLDVPLELIEIQAAIVNVSKDCGLSVGVNNITFNSKHALKEITFQPFGDKPEDNKFSGSFKGIVNGNEFLTSINLLEKRNHSKVLARPSVITMNNLTAVMDQSETYYLPVQGHEGGDLYSISGSIKLQVTPHLIVQDGINQIQLILDIKDEQVTPGSKESKDKVNSSSISTQAIVCEGQSVLIGGYFHESFVNGNGGIPILKELPIIGYAFKNTTRNKGTSERLFLITPRIIHLSASEDHYKGLFQMPSTLLEYKERVRMNFLHEDALSSQEANTTPENKKTRTQKLFEEIADEKD